MSWPGKAILSDRECAMGFLESLSAFDCQLFFTSHFGLATLDGLNEGSSHEVH